MTIETGPLLRSGNIKDYAPLGEEGNPVYKWATQIRVTIKRKINTESAQVFAIPQPNENGDIIDWYAPKAGLVIPWSSATVEEKESAKEQLDAIKQQLDITGDESRHSENTEQSVFNRLLKHVLQFPDDEHVYLVNGKPVLTFWGFVNTDATPRPNPLAILVIPEPKKVVDVIPSPVTSAVEAVTSTVEAVPVKRRSFWWWLLPLLLLLLLLLFLLRGCEETADIPLLKKLGNNTESEIPLDDKLIPDPTQTVTGREINTIHDGIVNDTTLQESIINSEEVLLEAEGLGTEVPEDQAQDMLPEQPALEEHLDEQEEQQTDLESEETELANEVPIEENEKLQEPMSSEENQMPNENSELQPLTIPEDLSQQNSMDFLDGHWQADSGLVDSRDKRPINLEYEFKDGKGHARIKRSDGSICSGAVEAKRNGSEVSFSEQEIIRCQNGDTFQPAEVKCRINSDKQTICEGTDSDGESFKMDINKATE